MLKRTISGIFYVAIIVAFFLLRRFVDYRLFDILIWAFCVLGTIEITRATINKTGSLAYYINSLYGIFILPLFFLFENFVFSFKPYNIVLIVLTVLIIFYALINSFSKQVKISKFLWQCLPLVYPSVFLMLLMLISRARLNNGTFFLILTFVISPCTDVMAYLVGMAYNKIRKGKAKKLCPKLSPKKTIAGAIGGIVGGVVGGIIAYYIINPTLNTNFPLLIIILISTLGSILTQIGDLFESFIKRSVNIKDIGKIIPGHGGIMDRIDGTLFTIPLFLVFALVI